MSNFIGVGIFWIGLNRADLPCWRLTLIPTFTVGIRSHRIKGLKDRPLCFIGGLPFLGLADNFFV